MHSGIQHKILRNLVFMINLRYYYFLNEHQRHQTKNPVDETGLKKNLRSDTLTASIMSGAFFGKFLSLAFRK
jgi:hypothetical protein